MIREEAPLSQCPLCGEYTDADEVDDGIDKQIKKEIKILIVGIILGGFLRQLFIWLQIGGYL